MAKYKDYVSYDRLAELLIYDSYSGDFVWRKSRSGQPKPGSRAGVLAPDGYIKITIDKHLYQAHRLAWFYMTGEWPEKEIDHIDLDKSNNSWVNLRPATHQQNMMNCRAKRRKKTHKNPIKGVYPTKGGKWLAKITFNGKARRLGVHRSQEEAYLAYCDAAKLLFGDFARP
jgi:hypothetical protein